jgi:hypothetical protein
MARIETDPNYSSPTFSRATAGTDLFKKEDVQALAAALSTHDHTPGKGMKISGTSINSYPVLTSPGSSSVQGQGTLNLIDTTGSPNLVLTAGAGNSRTKSIRVEPVQGSLEVVNSTNTAVIFSLTDGGALTIPSSLNSGTHNITGNLTATGNVEGQALRVTAASGGVVYFAGNNDAYIQRTAPGALASSGQWQCVSLIVNTGPTSITGTLTTNTLVVTGAASITGGITGGQVTTNAGPVISSGSVYSRAGGGNYLAGPSDQSSLGMWNPGEFRVTSSPGNFYVLGVITAEGGPVTGKGAYVNSASSETVKQNIVELDPTASLAQVMDTRMRPVQFEYIEPLPPATTLAAPAARGKDAGELTPEDAVPVTWTDERLGFIAEEVALVIPSAVGIIEGTSTAHGLITEALIPVLWGAMRALNDRVTALEAA